jgi:hypothetical protein
MVVLTTFSLLFSNHVVTVHASDPSLTEILTHLSFTNVAESTVETFPLGTYNITLYAEFAQPYDENELSFYQVNTSNFNPIFTGPEGGFGYLTPITKTFTTVYQFGLSLSRTTTLPFRYFTETSRNPKEAQCAKIYRNLDDLSMFLIGFDERTYCDETGDKDYNDMVFSLKLQHYLTVVSPYDTPSGEGWHYNGTAAFASLADEIIDHGNGTRRLFTNWSGDASGTNHSKSEPIYMDQNKTAIANWKTQYYLTVTSHYGSPTPSSGWFDAGTSITASVTSPLSNTTATRYVCTGWSGTGSAPASGYTSTVTFTINEPSNITWIWKNQHLLTVLTTPTGLTPQPTRNPMGEAGPANGWWYDSSEKVTLTAQIVTGYTFNYWDVDGVSQGSGVNPITLFLDSPHTATVHYTSAQPPPPLLVSISPISASIYVGDPLSFTSTVSGGTPPYTYQWYLNGASVSGATSNTWTFAPTASGIYYVYLKVTDSRDSTTQSETARIVTTTVPVGGYSLPIQVHTKAEPVLPYIILVVTLAVIFTKLRLENKRKR